MTRRFKKEQIPLDEPALYDYAVKALGRRMRTVAELKRLMRSRVEPGEVGDAMMGRVIARLKEQRYLNDTGYASSYARMRQENQSFGRRRVQQDLVRKGVRAEVIAKTLDAAYEDVNEEELARRHLERKRVQKPANDKEAARVMRMLVRAGFSTGVIFRILKKWDVGDESLAALEFMDDDGPESSEGGQ
ncbi:MAG: regulatory protein RecX [Silvibacterium sp.]|nr:regulatory protein RecX [Silvibacterium sp.]